MDILYRIPPMLLLLAVVGLAVGAVLGGQQLVHRRFDGSTFVVHNEVGGVIIVVVASLYAVLLGFMTVIAWEHFQESREIVVAEADASIDAWHTAVGLSPDVRTRIRADVVHYGQIMVDREWDLMKRGRSDPAAAMTSMDALDVTGGFAPQTLGQSNAQSATLQQLDIMHDARQRRIASNEAGLSGFEWLVLALGAGCIFSFCWLFGGANPKVQMVMTGTVVVMIMSTLVLLFELQYPFRSGMGVDSATWRGALKHIHEMEAGPMSDMR